MTALTTATPAMSWRTVLAASPDPYTVGSVARVAVRVAADIIADGQASEATPEDLVAAQAALNAVRPTVAQAQALSRVVNLGADYMTAVGYADDPDEAIDADERTAARVLAADGGSLIGTTYRALFGSDLPFDPA